MEHRVLQTLMNGALRRSERRSNVARCLPLRRQYVKRRFGEGGGDGFIPDIAYQVRYLNREIAERELGVQMAEALSESRYISIDAFREQLKASQERYNERLRSEMKRFKLNTANRPHCPGKSRLIM